MHAFLSYSHKDTALVDNLISFLVERGINVWIDTHGLSPGTPEWDKAIRSAIGNASLVIAICSENTRESNYVAIELEIAADLSKQIYPVWVHGEIWWECSPISLVLSQYADLRPPHCAFGAESFLNSLTEAVACHAPSDRAPVEWPYIEFKYGKRSIVINPFSFSTRTHLLTDIYTNLLQETFPPFTYGQTWALYLGSTVDPVVEIGLLALPACWAQAPFNPANQLDPHWMMSAPDLWHGRMVHVAAKQRRGASRASYSELRILNSPIRIVDLNNLSRHMREIGLEFSALGIVGGSKLINSLTIGGHPKVMLINCTDAVHSDAQTGVELFETANTVSQGVVVGSGCYVELLRAEYDPVTS